MKTKDIVKQHGIDKAAFEAWLPNSGYTFKTSALGGVDVDDSQDIGSIVGAFKEYHASWQQEQQQKQEEAARASAQAAAAAKEEAANKQRALANMLITSGFSFDGYTITKYSGYISGDDAVSVPRKEGFWSTTTDVGDALMASLVKIRRQALVELKEAAYALGCNAVIGVDFDYLTLDPEVMGAGNITRYLPYVFGVTANGNAVVIEKNDRTGSAQ